MTGVEWLSAGEHEVPPDDGWLTVRESAWLTGDGWSALAVKVDGGAALFEGWWRRYGAFLLTVAASHPTAPPVSLDPVPGLADAEPVHSWLERPGPTGP